MFGACEARSDSIVAQRGESSQKDEYPALLRSSLAVQCGMPGMRTVVLVAALVAKVLHQ